MSSNSDSSKLKGKSLIFVICMIVLALSNSPMILKKYQRNFIKLYADIISECVIKENCLGDKCDKTHNFNSVVIIKKT